MAVNGQAGAFEPHNPQKQLLEALLCEDIVTFEDLLQDPQVNPLHLYKQPVQGTCLDVASESGRHVFVSALLKRLGTESLRSLVRPPPEHLAARGGHGETLAALLAARGSTTALDQYGRTALHYACYYAKAANLTGYKKCVEIILQTCSVDFLNTRDKLGYTAIHLTASEAVQGFPDDGILGGASNADGRRDEDKCLAKRQIAELLLQLSHEVIDIDSPNSQGSTARQTLTKSFPSLRPFLPLRTDHLCDPHKCLIEAISKRQIDIFRALLFKSDANDDPILDPNHWFSAPINATVLELACSRTRGDEFVRVLLDCGADPDIPNKFDFKFPIHIVCQRGDAEMLRALVNYDTATVDLNSTDAKGNTALHYLARANNDVISDSVGKRNCLDELLKHNNLFVNRINDDGETPLHVALAYKNRNFIEMIITRKSDRINLDIKGRKRNLREWIRECYSDITLPLENPNRRSMNFAMPEKIKLIELLKKRREEEVVRLVEAHPMTAVGETDRQNTPLQYAARFGMGVAAQALLLAGADPNDVASGNHSPPIVLACYYGHRNVLEKLLDSDARTPILVDKADDKHNTALHYAAQRRDLESVIMLLQHGAKWKIKNALGRRPLDGCLKELLDQCVTTNGAPPYSSKHEVIFDYRLFTSASHETHVQATGSRENLIDVGRRNRGVRSEIQFFPILLHYSKGPELLNHPVAASFIHLKWSRIRCLIYSSIISLILYLFFLNFHIVQNGQSEPYIQDSIVPGGFITEVFLNETHIEFPHPIDNLPFFFYPVFGMSAWFLLVELLHCLFGSFVYRRNTENIVNIATYIMALAAIVPPAYIENYVVQRWLYVLTIMLSCGNLFLLTGRVRQFAKNIEMLKVVLKRYILTATSYVIILIAFALSFHIAFRHVPMPVKADADRFQNMPYTLVKMLTMFVGELDSSTLPLEKTTTGTLLFVVFVLGVTVVLQNLLIGLAVSDLETIHDDAERRWIATRVCTIMDTETKLAAILNIFCIPVLRTCPSIISFFWRGPLFPNVNDLRREASLVPGRPASLRLNSATAKERPLDPKIVRGATELLRLRNEEILLLRAESYGTNCLITNTTPVPSNVLTLTSSWLGESAC